MATASMTYEQKVQTELLRRIKRLEIQIAKAQVNLHGIAEESETYGVSATENLRWAQGAIHKAHTAIGNAKFLVDRELKRNTDM